MTVNTLISTYNKTGKFDKELVKYVLEYGREELISEVASKPNRKFALDLLDKVIEERQNEDYEIGTGDNIMLASYLVGLHKQVEDSLAIWNAKRIDFDSYCYVDIQLVVFAGIDKTLNYLEGSDKEDSTEAIEYIKGCHEAGDFDELEDYFSMKKLPWWV